MFSEEMKRLSRPKAETTTNRSESELKLAGLAEKTEPLSCRNAPAELSDMRDKTEDQL